MGNYIIGIDQGGSKTDAVVMNLQGEILGYHSSRGCYFPSDGIEMAVAAMAEAVDIALKDSAVNFADVEMLVAGVTGIDYEGDEQIVVEALASKYPRKPIKVCNDCEIAYYGGSLNTLGAVICAGTGINAAFFTPQKKFVMGDYLKSSLQGGSAIARRAIETVIEVDLGLFQPTKLTDLFLRYSKESQVTKLIEKYITDERFAANIRYLVPKILELAAEDDQVAKKIFDDYATELAACFLAGLRKMDLNDSACDIVLAGSVLKGSTNYLKQKLLALLSEVAIKAQIIDADFEPVVGAGILAILEKTGDYGEAVKDRTTKSAQAHGLLRA